MDESEFLGRKMHITEILRSWPIKRMLDSFLWWSWWHTVLENHQKCLRIECQRQRWKDWAYVYCLIAKMNKITMSNHFKIVYFSKQWFECRRQSWINCSCVCLQKWTQWHCEITVNIDWNATDKMDELYVSLLVKWTHFCFQITSGLRKINVARFARKYH